LRLSAEQKYEIAA
jgi:hypothetical protein